MNLNPEPCNRSVCLLPALLILQARPALSAEDPDQLYRQREDLASATRAVEIWSASAATDSRRPGSRRVRPTGLAVTHRSPNVARRSNAGSLRARSAIRLMPERPEGHFWLAADMGALAESFGLSQGFKYRSRIKSELERVEAIDPSWEQASADTALGRGTVKVPRLFGGSRAKAEEHFRRVLDRFPQSKNALLFLAESLIAQKKTDEARALLQRVIDAPIEMEWAPEDRDVQAQGGRSAPIPHALGVPAVTASVRRAACALVVCGAFAAACARSPTPAPAAHLVERSHTTMGTELRLTAWTATSPRAVAAFDGGVRRIRSPRRADERLEGRQRHPAAERAPPAIMPVPVSAETREVLRVARQVSEWTGRKVRRHVRRAVGPVEVRPPGQGQHAFPIADEVAQRLPLINYRDLEVDERAGTAFLKRKGMRVNLGGIGKGYAVDRAVDILRRSGLRDFMIQAGGDMYVAGQRGDRPWRLGIRDPRGPADKSFRRCSI